MKLQLVTADDWHNEIFTLDLPDQLPPPAPGDLIDQNRDVYLVKARCYLANGDVRLYVGKRMSWSEAGRYAENRRVG